MLRAATLQGVPAYMSASTSTPLPSSSARTRLQNRSLKASISTPGSSETASTRSLFPAISSLALTIASASPPWDTTSIPTIPVLPFFCQSS